MAIGYRRIAHGRWERRDDPGTTYSTKGDATSRRGAVKPRAKAAPKRAAKK